MPFYPQIQLQQREPDKMKVERKDMFSVYNYIRVQSPGKENNNLTI